MKSQDSYFLGVEDAPEGWRVGNYQNDAVISNRGLYEYIDKICKNGRTIRVAVFFDFRVRTNLCPKHKGYGVYVLDQTIGNTDWTLFGNLVKSHKEAVHLMIAYAQLGAFDVHSE